jgi:hypothetical protein
VVFLFSFNKSLAFIIPRRLLTALLYDSKIS